MRIIQIYLENRITAPPRAVNFHRSGRAATRSQPPMAVYLENSGTATPRAGIFKSGCGWLRFRPSMMVYCLIAALLFGVFSIGQQAKAEELHPLYPIGFDKKNLNKDILHNPYEPTDPLYPFQHVDENAEYYLGSGAMGDTFFVTFEPPAACSVKYVEMQWFDAGNVNAFAAWYSDEALAMFPDGTAPDRGQSPVSPIGEWLAGPVPNTSTGAGWELFDLGGTEFICGDPITLESDIFGAGFIKSSSEPHPLADRMDSKGIRYTYTWFGGPWMSTYPYPWGAYSSNIATGTVIDMMMRVWVSYPWGMPIQISNVSQHCNTFNYQYPYLVSCILVDDGHGITAEDYISVIYTVNGGPENSVLLSETAPGRTRMLPYVFGSSRISARITA